MRRIAIWIFLFAFTVFTISACSKNVNPLAPSAKSPANKTKTLDEASDSLIDNFENDQSYASGPGQRDAMWWVSNASCYWLWPVSNTYGNSSTCLRVHYAKSAGQEWSFISAGGLMDAGKFHNFTSASSISMQVCGQVALMVKFEDADGHQSGDTETLTANTPSSWSALNWNLTGMNWGSCDRSRITNIFIFVQPGQVAEGEFFLDDLQAAAPTATPVPTAIVTVTPVTGPGTTVNWAIKAQGVENFMATEMRSLTFNPPLADGGEKEPADIRNTSYWWPQYRWAQFTVSFGAAGVVFKNPPAITIHPHYFVNSDPGGLAPSFPPSAPEISSEDVNQCTVRCAMLFGELTSTDIFHLNWQPCGGNPWSYNVNLEVIATGPVDVPHSNQVIAGTSGDITLASGVSQDVPFTITLAPQNNGVIVNVGLLAPQAGQSSYFPGSDDYDNSASFRSTIVSSSQSGNVITGIMKIESITP